MSEEAIPIQPFDNSIRDPLRIQRIMKKIGDASVPVVLRIEGPRPVSIKARVSGLNPNIAVPHLVLDQLSWRADQILKNSNFIRVDLIGMSASVHFYTSVLSRSEGQIIVAHPTKIESIERRSNRRVLITSNSPQCFLKFNFKNYLTDSPAATPIMHHCESLAQFARACDVSFSGLCLIYRFPEMANFLRPGATCENVELRLPMHLPISVGVKIRWVRKIRENSVDGGNDQMAREFRVGLEFLLVDAALKNSLAAYIRRIEVGDVV